MTITATVSADQQEITLHIKGRFDYSSHEDFRRAYERVEAQPKQYIVDMQEAPYLDSSALGMLLLLKDFAGENDAVVSIINCNDDTKQILSSANFEHLFSIN